MIISVTTSRKSWYSELLLSGCGLQNPEAATSRSELPGLLFSPPGPAELRKLFEKLGATYIKLGQVRYSSKELTIYTIMSIQRYFTCTSKFYRSQF